MVKKKYLLIAVLILCSATYGLAAQVTFSPRLTLSEEYTDNVFRTPDNPEEDFIFSGRMHPHSLAGTEGAEIVENLERQKEDYWLPKPRFSAFFNTGLETWLHEREVTLCAVAGIATPFCVLSTALDALCHDFKTVLLEDCSAASSLDQHQQTLGTYRRNPLYPLFRVMTSPELMEDVSR